MPLVGKTDCIVSQNRLFYNEKQTVLLTRGLTLLPQTSYHTLATLSRCPMGGIALLRLRQLPKRSIQQWQGNEKRANIAASLTHHHALQS